MRLGCASLLALVVTSLPRSRWGSRSQRHSRAGARSGMVLRPLHACRWANDGSTSLDETLPVCHTLHHDLHEGGKTVRLRDSRYLLTVSSAGPPS